MVHLLLTLMAGHGAMLNAQVLVSATPIVQHEVAWLRNNGVPSALYDVQVWKIIYHTLALDGSPSVASAAFVEPVNTCITPLLCFIHGTTFVRSDVPSNWNEASGGAKDVYDYASNGIACILPDLLGLGDSPGLHPYLHASSEASACMDAVRAAREFREQRGDTLGRQLFLLGKSAGAHACLATAQAMQTDHPEEFNVTAAVGIDGPYAVFPVIRDEMIADEPTEGVANLVYILMAYNEAYPALFNGYSDFLVPPYDVVLPPLYDGYHSKDQIDPLLPDTFSMLVPEALEQSTASDPSSPLNLRFKENTVFNWAPLFPLRLYYCTSDQFVLPENSQLAVNAFQAQGATDVDAIVPAGNVDHGDCGALSQPLALQWIFSLKAGCDGTFGALQEDDLNFSLVPNPANGGSTELQFSPGNEGMRLAITVINVLGQDVLSQVVQCDGYNRVALNTRLLQAGTYYVQVIGKRGRDLEKLVVVE